MIIQHRILPQARAVLLSYPLYPTKTVCALQKAFSIMLCDITQNLKTIEHLKIMLYMTLELLTRANQTIDKPTD
mgnify:FL=1